MKTMTLYGDIKRDTNVKKSLDSAGEGEGGMI